MILPGEVFLFTQDALQTSLDGPSVSGKTLQEQYTV